MSNQFYNSGEGNTTGREVFEDGTGGVTGQGGGQYGSGNTGLGGNDNYNSGNTGLGQGDNYNSGNTGLGQGDNYNSGNTRLGQGDNYNSGNTGLGQRDNYDSGNVGYNSGNSGNFNSGNTGVTGDKYDSDVGAGSYGQAQAGVAGFGGQQDQSATGGHHHHQHHHETHGDSYGANTAGTGIDRTGHLQQDASLYERTGADGPLTGGAAGTDRFDVDNSGTGVDRYGAEGTGYGAKNSYPDLQGDANRKGTGGIAGILTTEDKDFTMNRDRVAGSNTAYNDDHGMFQSNTKGPGGSALTGREGNPDINPVAQDQTRLGTDKNTAEQPHKRGIVEKIKDIVS